MSSSKRKSKTNNDFQIAARECRARREQVEKKVRRLKQKVIEQKKEAVQAGEGTE
jgi:hypothetical protein